MTITTTRGQRRQLARENAKQPIVLAEFGADLSKFQGPVPPTRVLRSREFLVQVFEREQHPLVVARLSVHRTALNGERWVDGITWEELQRIKLEAGYGMFDAVEVYPQEHHVVNVANMRHLWVLRDVLPYAWR